MKKHYLLLAILLACLHVSAQTSTLTKLVDSLPSEGWHIIETINNKLYTFPYYKGGEVSEVDLNTGVLTPVLTLPIMPAFPSQFSYNTYSGNFVMVKNKLVAAYSNPAGPEKYIIAAGNAGVDTLLSNNLSFGRIQNIDTMVFLTFKSNNNITGSSLYATNLSNPVTLIDSNVLERPKTGTKELFYRRENFPNAYDKKIMRTNGIAKVEIEGTTGSSYDVSIIGEINYEMYFTKTHRGVGMDTTWLKKCDAMGVVSIVDTIMMNATVIENGLVGLGSKLIIPFKQEASPFYQDFIVYDIATNTKVNITQNTMSIRTYDLEQTQVAPNHFYYSSINPIQRYISDGTIIGTKPYGTQAAGFGTDLGFENYSSYQSLGNKAIICNEYPLANMNDEFYYGTDTGLVLYKLYPTIKTKPSHFVHIGNSIYFTIQTSNPNKISIMKMTGCDMPISNPLSINNVNSIDASVFPNPSSNAVFTIQSENLNDSFTYNVVNSIGQKIPFEIVRLANNVIEVKLSTVHLGVYFLQMKNENFNSQVKLLVN